LAATAAGCSTAAFAREASKDPFAAAKSIDLTGLPSKEQLWEWLLWMNSLGPRLTGNPAHVEFVDFLAREMAALPGVQVSRETHTFANGGRWDAKSYSLQLIESGRARPLPVTSYYPYSGGTPPEGITAEVVYGGRTPNFTKGDFHNKILLLDAPVVPVMYDQWYRRWGSYQEGLDIPSGLTESIYQQFCAPELKQFKDEGALGVILAWQGISDANARDQYIPFSKPRHDIPALWVGEKTGAELKAAAARGAKVTLTLDAQVYPDATSDAIFATLAGKTDETVLIVTHTDGGNASEENGGLALMAIARHLASLAPGSRQRTFVFVFTTGHMAHAQIPMLTTFGETHQELVHKTVVGMAIEHLGSREWAQDKAGRYVPTGKSVISWAITEHRYLADLMLACAKGTIDDRTLAVNPVAKLFTGEGALLYRAGIPTLGFIPIPTYLLTAPQSGEIDKMDATLFRVQVEVLTRVARHLDTMDRQHLHA
jgi:hypothetical protein